LSIVKNLPFLNIFSPPFDALRLLPPSPSRRRSQACATERLRGGRQGKLLRLGWQMRSLSLALCLTQGEGLSYSVYMSPTRPEITNISEHGFWIFIRDSEYFLPFEKFPWFKNAKISQISNVELWHQNHLYWPELDVDLSLEIIDQPGKYRLIAK